MSFFAYLFNPWSNNKQQKKRPIPKQPELAQYAQGRKVAQAILTEALDSADGPKGIEQKADQAAIKMTSFPPFIPTAPNPHGTREFLRAAIAERSGTPQQVVRASEDIRRVNEEALKQVKENEGRAASSLKAILARCPPPLQERKENTGSPPPSRQGCAHWPQSPSSTGGNSPGRTEKGHTLEKRKKPSYSHLRIPRKPQKVLRKPDRYRRQSQMVDPRLSPLGPMAERLQAMAMEEYDSERDGTD